MKGQSPLTIVHLEEGSDELLIASHITNDDNKSSKHFLEVNLLLYQTKAAKIKFYLFRSCLVWGSGWRG